MDTTRRDFLTGWGAAAGSLVVGFGTSPAAQAQTASPGTWPSMPPIAMQRIEGGPEVNAWVVVQPDDRVIVRIARSEMGQGTLTGLAQLVCEELECDWSKVTTEYPTP
ncbi:MAG: twin-arginine translocation signal domain-containing protein, partial [Betaproteobacteria bacterium]|nr:twin-arginine translocation signal domain-containing protein [Betaproteobacteria bacterium]